MPGAHIADVMAEVRRRIQTIAPLFDPIPLRVEIGNPAQFHPRAAADDHLVTLFLYRIKQDHAAMLSTPGRGLAVQLKVLITAYGVRPDGVAESVGSVELRILSHILRLFMEAPILGTVKLAATPPLGVLTPFVTEGVQIEAQHLELDMEEINHIWTTQGETPFRTSLSYIFRYGIVAPEAPSGDGPPVLVATSDVTPEMPGEAAPVAVNYGALAFRIASGLDPSLTLPVPGGGSSVALFLVTEEVTAFDLVAEILDTVLGAWQPLGGVAPAQIASLDREGLDPAALPAGTIVTLPDPGGPAVIRFRAVHPTEPEAWQIGAATLVFAEGGGP